jgi:2-polyprenyl-6-methoxyphenol hydroxylase-like FAD-dependent oxidoreductase
LDLILDFWPNETMFTMWFEAADSGLVMVLSKEPLLVRIVGTTERACRRLQQMFSVQRVVWDSSYISSYRLADSYGRGNVWLAGDACHVHSPLGGRGMNTGISDAIALAAAVGRGDLSGYENERRPPSRMWVWTNYFLSQIAMGRGAGFQMVRRVCAVLIRGLAYLLGPDFAAISFRTMTTSVVTRKVAAGAPEANLKHTE